MSETGDENSKSTWETLKEIAGKASDLYSKFNLYYGVTKSVLSYMGIDLFKENDELQSLITSYYNDLKKELKELADYLEAHDKSTKIENIAVKMSPIRAQLETIKHVKPPFIFNDKYENMRIIDECNISIKAFEDPGSWQRPFRDKYVYRDGWSSSTDKYFFNPIFIDSDKTLVFDYRLALPAYLEALSSLLLVISTISPNYKTDPIYDYNGLLMGRATFLRSMFTKINSGIKDMRRPERKEFFGSWNYFSKNETHSFDMYTYKDEPEWEKWKNHNYIYGVVDCSTGLISSSSYIDDRFKTKNGDKVIYDPDLVKSPGPVALHNNGEISYAEWISLYPGERCYKEIVKEDFYYNKFLPKHKIRTIQERKKICINIGLDNIGRIINNIAGQILIPEADKNRSLRNDIIKPIREEMIYDPKSKIKPSQITIRDIFSTLEMENTSSIRQIFYRELL